MRSTRRPSTCPFPPRVPMVDRPFPPRRHRWPTSSCARQPRKSRWENGLVRGERPASRPLGNAVCSPKRRELDTGRWRMKAIVVTDEAAGTAGMTLAERPEPNAAENDVVHGAAGGVGSMVTQLAKEAGAYVIGTGRSADRQTALDFGAQEFVDLQNDSLEDVGGVDLVFDVIGGDIGKRSAALVRAGGMLVTIAGPPEAQPADGLAVDFVVEADRAQLGEVVQRVRDGRLRTNIGTVAALDDAVAAFNPTERIKGKTIIRVRP